MPSKRAKSGRAKKRRLPFDVWVRRLILLTRPTRRPPGRADRVRLLRMRARYRLPLFVEGDAGTDPARRRRGGALRRLLCG